MGAGGYRQRVSGDTVSCTQAEALVLAAEAKTGLRPKRHTDLLAQRILMFERQIGSPNSAN